MFRYLWAAFSLFIILIIISKLANLHQALPQSEQRGSPLAAELFEQLRKQKLLSIDDDGQVHLPEKDDVLAERAKGSSAELSHLQALIDELYYRQHGKRVQKQVALWNYTRRLAAIRDNRPQTDDSNRWQVSNENALPVDVFSLVPLSFGYLTEGKLQTGFNDWLGASHSSQRLIFRSEFDVSTAKTRTVTLHIIGKPDVSALTAYKPRLTTCTPEGCSKTTSHAPASVTIVRLTLPAKPVRLEIPVSTIRNPTNAVSGLALMRVDEEQVQSVQRAIDNDCAAVPKPKDESPTKTVLWNNCRLALNRQQSDGHRKPYKPFQIITQDGEALTKAYDQNHLSDMGKATDYTQKNGLLALIGQDKHDDYSLSGLMWQSDLAGAENRLQLTLDSRLQHIAQQALEKGIQTHQGKRSQQRRAAVVMLHPKTGQILAAANYPNPAAGSHWWDRKAISQLYPTLDPYRFNPWQGLDGNNTPGSTFKIVTALAAMQAAKDNPQLENMLEGLRPEQYQASLGLNPASLQYQVGDMKKPVKTHSIHEANAPLFAGQCGKTERARGKVGLAEATSKSLNNWFMHLGVLLDRSHIKQTGQPSILLSTAEQLGFDQVYSLGATGLKHYQGNRQQRGDVLNAFGGRLGLKEQPAVFMLANNSYGQGLSTTPLQIARLAATVATGKDRQPQLIQQIGNQRIKPHKATTVRMPYRDALKMGMSAVVLTGTAKRKFDPSLKCQVYGKTGTAEVEGGNNSMWFMGWYEPEPKRPELAFACMATHYPNRVYGADVCAPIINDILLAWQKQPAP